MLTYPWKKSLVNDILLGVHVTKLSPITILDLYRDAPCNMSSSILINIWVLNDYIYSYLFDVIFNKYLYVFK